MARMEVVLQLCLNSRSASEISWLQQNVTSDEEVLFYGSMVSASWEEGVCQVLLHMIAKHLVELQWFSFTRTLIYKYKQ